MKISKKIMLMVLTALLIFVFSGCSSNTNNDNASDTDQNSNQNSSDNTEKFELIGDALKYDPNIEVAEGKDVTLSVWVPAAWESFYQEMAEAYREYHPNVSFEWTITSFDDHWKKVPLALKSDSGPDLFWMHNSQNAVVLPNMEPLPEDMFPMDKLKEDFRNVEANVIDDKLYYTDMGLMTGVIYYNTDIWKEAGLTEADIPETWDEFREIAKKLTKKTENGDIRVSGFNMNGAEYFWNDLMYQQGKFLFDKSGKVAKFNSPEALKAAQLMYDLYHTDEVGSGTQPLAEQAFANNQAAMMYRWGWASNYLKSNFPDLNYSAFKLPVFDKNNIPAYGRANGDVSLGVSKNAPEDEKEAALNFVKFQFANNDFLVKYDVFDGMAPTKKSLDNRPEIQEEPVLRVETEIVSKVIWPGAVPNSYFSGVQKYIGQAMLINKTSPEEALKEAEQQINKDLEGTDFVSVESKYVNASEMSYQ